MNDISSLIARAYQRVLDEIQASAPGPGIVECGECGFRWDDTLITSLTPAPAGRCPNEYNHDEPGTAYVQIAVRVPVALEGDSDVLGRIAEAAQDYVNETYPEL